MTELARGIKINLLANFLRFSRAGFTAVAVFLYGTEYFGVYTVVWAATEVLLTFGRLGLNQGLLFELAHLHGSGERAKLYGRIAASLKAMLLISSLETIGFILYGYFYVNIQQTRYSIYLLAPLIPPYTLGLLLLSATMGLKDMRYNALIRSGAEPGALFLLVLLFWKTPWKEYGIILAQAGSLLVTVWLAFWAYSRHFSWRETMRALSVRNRYRELVRYSFPMYLITLLDIILHRSDIFLISALLGTGTLEQKKLLGVYGFAKQIARVLYKVKTSFSQIFIPVTSESFLAQEMDRTWSHLQYTVEKLLLLSTAFVLFLAGFGLHLINLVGKEAALLPQAAFFWLLAGQFSFASSAVLSFFLVTIGRAKRILIQQATLALVALVGGYFLTDRLGATGAAAAVGLGYVTMGLVALTELIRLHPVDFKIKKSLQLLAAGLLTGTLLLVATKLIPSGPATPWVALAVSLIASLGYLMWHQRVRWQELFRWRLNP